MSSLRHTYRGNTWRQPGKQKSEIISEIRLEFFHRVSHKYQQNLLKNASGELTSETELALQETRALDEDFLMSPWPEYPFWKIWSSAGEGWKVKMCKDPEKFTIYFFTSYHSCTKEQLIDLEDHFPNDRLLFRSDMQTNLSVEQWYKFTGPCTLDLSIDLLDKHRGKLDRIEKFIVYKHPGEAQEVWKNLSFTLTRSFKDVRYLKFYHGGTCDEVIEDEETQKIVGACLAQASVSLSLPELVLK